MNEIHIYHTNDVHSEFLNFAKVSQYIKLNYHKDTDILVDAGDFCDAKSIIISGSNGNSGIRLLNDVGYDALVIGNNEFFLGIDALSNLSNEKMKLLSCNLTDLKGKHISNLEPYTLVERNGIKVLLIGTSPHFSTVNDFTNMVGIRTYNPKETISSIIMKELGNFDVCILVSHLGYRKDVKLAEELKYIDLIIGGHSHTLMKKMELVNNTWITQAGCYGENIGKVTIHKNDSNILISSEMLNVEDLETDTKFLELVKEEENHAVQVLSKVEYTLDREYTFDSFVECDAMNLLCDIMLNHFGGDFCLMHHGILSMSIPKEISKYALLKISPSPLNPTMVKWTGKQIRKAIVLSRNEQLIHGDGRGAGFRGNVLGTLAVSHNVYIDTDQIIVDDKPLEDNQEYTVITDDYLQRGGGYEFGYPSLKVREEDCKFYDGYIRDLLENELNHKEHYKFVKKRRRFDI